MGKEDLIKKLEKIELPEIENPNHKRWLKMVLISQMDNQKAKRGIFVWFKKPLIPLGSIAVIILICFIINNLFIPQYTFAEVREITMQNPQIKELINKGAEIKDIKIIENKAYALITPKESVENPSIIFNGNGEKTAGVLAEIELKEKRVAKIEKIASQVSPLTTEEEKTVERLIQESELSAKDNKEKFGVGATTEGKTVDGATPILQETKKIKIERIESLPVPLELVKTDHTVKVLPVENEDLKAKIIYMSGDERKEGIVNITEGKTEQTKVLEEVSTTKKE